MFIPLQNSLQNCVQGVTHEYANDKEIKILHTQLCPMSVWNVTLAESEINLSI